jgi:hypothetical protein
MAILKGPRVDGYVNVNDPVKFTKNVLFQAGNPWGDIYYVNKTTGVDSNPGTSSSLPVKTIAQAITLAAAYDWIFVAPGVYDEGEETVLAYEGMKLIGSNTSGIEWGPCSMKADGEHIISVQANGCEIAYLGFIQNGAYRGIEIDHTAAVYKTHIHHCHFGGSATATYGVIAGATFDAVDTVIEDCEFLSWATAGIYLNATRSKVRRNIFFVPDSGIGIEYVPSTADRPYGLIADNYIVGTGSSDTGIKHDGDPSAGMLIQVNNIVLGCNTKITTLTNGAGLAANNYTGADDGTITAIDTDK